MQPTSGHEMVHSVEELRLLVSATREAGGVEDSEARIASRAFSFADLTAGALMTPRHRSRGRRPRTPYSPATRPPRRRAPSPRPRLRGLPRQDRRRPQRLSLLPCPRRVRRRPTRSAQSLLPPPPSAPHHG